MCVYVFISFSSCVCLCLCLFVCLTVCLCVCVLFLWYHGRHIRTLNTADRKPTNTEQIYCRQRQADSREQTAESRQQTAESRQQTQDSRQQSSDIIHFLHQNWFIPWTEKVKTRGSFSNIFAVPVGDRSLRKQKWRDIRMNRTSS